MENLQTLIDQLKIELAMKDKVIAELTALNDYNFLVATDSYKLTHRNMYPNLLQKVVSYMESRGVDPNSNFAKIKSPYTVFFGLQYYIKKYLMGVQVTPSKIDEAEKLSIEHFGQNLFNREQWEYIVRVHGGKLPLRIKALPEGSVVTIKNALMLIESTDENCAWLTNYAETLLMKIWYTITIASNSRVIKEMQTKYYKLTGCDIFGVYFGLHDFGYRGVSSEESAALGGAAHLVNYMGTDTLAGIRMLQKYYGATSMPGFSVPASEHSVMCSHGRHNEVGAYRHILEKHPFGIVSIVSDTYNIYNAAANIVGGELKDMVMTRTNSDGTPAKTVIRPDSGDPVLVICGDPSAPEGSLERKGIINILGEKFGYTVNKKGFKELDPHVGVIQGDGVDFEVIEAIYENLMAQGWAANVLIFGSGGKLLQNFTRDTMKFAIKACYAIIDGVEMDIQKTPITDNGKRSKKGQIKVVKTNDDGYVTVEMKQGEVNFDDDQLVTVFENGELIKEYTLDEIRERSKVVIEENELLVV